MDKQLLLIPSEKVAHDAAGHKCQTQLDAYNICIQKNKHNNALKQCIELMDQFRYCTLLNAKLAQSEQKAKEV
ncbi:unnamed protein product [Paramecium octaurelia]|uniref:Uncharacterized protein n=1 Tax=Paramecium octaurelia TaxID=43137 RepID=A0A8S1SPA3_PAROT|nr:unnamed protein product [Paramecium octaurelia]